MDKILVLKGGISPERDVSLVSAAAVCEELQRLGYEVMALDPADYPDLAAMLGKISEIQPDLIFNALHGGSGENGELQAALELSNWKFTGSQSKACLLAMDKYVSKLIVEAEGIPVPDCILMRYDLLEDYQDTADYENFIAKLGLPLIVKPVDAGSSVGISLVKDIAALKPAVEDAFRFCNQVLLERYIPGKELTVTVINGKAMPVVEIKPLSGWYDYNNKYTKGKTEYIAPAILETAVTELVQMYAERIWKALGCRHYARIDFRYDDEAAWFLEVNTLPGMTELSLTPKAALAAGLSFGELLKTIILSANA